MESGSRDDWSVLFAGDHRLDVGARDLPAVVRAAVETSLAAQLGDVELRAVAAHGTPRFVTLGRRAEEDRAVRVVCTGFCVEARLTVSRAPAGAPDSAVVPSALTCFFGPAGDSARLAVRAHLDVFANARHGLREDTFRSRLEAFRSECRRADR